MNIFNKIYCRLYQLCFRIALPFLPYRQPKILESNEDLAAILNNQKLQKPLIVTDKTLNGLGLTKALESALSKNGIDYVKFDKVLPNPTISIIEEGLNIYKAENCDCIIALGGGSVIDCAKVIGARYVKPTKQVNQMKGLLKICKKLPTLIAIPTTAGTGSETTLAAVITDDKTHHKYPINDFSLIPHYALLDYNLTLGLNKKITSTTGMDALTHSIEAYIGQSTTPQTRKAAIESVNLIKDNLLEVYNNGQNTAARQNMLKASYLAGVAFTKSYVGYIHAIAHSLGGKYGVPHGLANAIILPVMLNHYGKSIHSKLGKLAKLSGIALQTDNNSQATEKFITFIEQLNQTFEIPNYIEQLKEEDIPNLSVIASKEANPLYPVPQLFDSKELEEVYKKLLKNTINNYHEIKKKE